METDGRGTSAAGRLSVGPPGSQVPGYHVGAILWLSFGHLVTDLFQGSVPALLPHWRESFHLAYAATAALMLALQAASSMVQPLFGLLADRVPLRWLLPVALVLGGLGLAWAVVAPGYGWVMAGIVVSGLGVALYHPEASRQAHYHSGTMRATAMSWFSVGGNMGMGLGPLFVAAAFALLGPSGAAVGFALAGLAAAGVMAWVRRHPAPAVAAPPMPAPSVPDTGASGYGQTSRRLPPVRWGPLWLLGGVVVFRSWLHSSLSTFIPLYAVHLGASAGQGRQALAVFLLAGALGTLAGGPLADRLGRKPVIVASMALMVPLAWAWTQAPPQWHSLLVGIGGFVLISTFSVSVVLAQELLPGRVGMASGIIMGLAIGTGGLGAAGVGLLADRVGLSAAVRTLVVFPLVGLALAALLPRRPGFPVRQHAPAGAGR